MSDPELIVLGVVVGLVLAALLDTHSRKRS